MSYGVKWEPISHSSSFSSQSASPADETFQTPRAKAKVNKPSSAASLMLTGIERAMLPLGSPRWSPRLMQTGGARNGQGFKGGILAGSIQNNETSSTATSAPIVHASGVCGVAVTNGTARQRIFFIGGKSVTSQNANDTLPVLALDIDESILGQSTAPSPRWRRFTSKDSYDGHVGARIGHTAVALQASRRTTKLDLFESRIQELDAKKAAVARVSKHTSDSSESKEKCRTDYEEKNSIELDGGGNSASTNHEERTKAGASDNSAISPVGNKTAADAWFIYVFGGVDQAGRARRNISEHAYPGSLLNSVVRMRVWNCAEQEPEAVGQWEVVEPQHPTKGSRQRQKLSDDEFKLETDPFVWGVDDDGMPLPRPPPERPCPRRGAGAVAISNCEMLVFGGYTLVERPPWLSPEERKKLEARRLEAEAVAQAKSSNKRGKKSDKIPAKDLEEDTKSVDRDDTEASEMSNESIEYEGKYLSDMWVFSAQDNAWRQPGFNGEGPPPSAYHAMMAVPLTGTGNDDYNAGSEVNNTFKACPVLFGRESITDLVEGKVVSQVVVLGGCRPNSTEERNVDDVDVDNSEGKNEVKGDEAEATSDARVANSICNSIDEIFILTITAGAEDDDISYKADSGGNNGFLWNWSRVATIPPMGSDGPSPRLWFGAAFGELLLTGIPPAPSERMKQASLILASVRRIQDKMKSSDMTDEEAEAILIRRYPQEMTRIKAESLGDEADNSESKKGKSKNRGSNDTLDYLKILKEKLNEEADNNAAVVRDERDEAERAFSSQGLDLVRPARRIFVYGGRSAQGLAHQDLWTLDVDTGKWCPQERSVTQKVDPHPRFGHVMVSTASLERVILFGGSDGRARLSDGQVLKLQIAPAEEKDAAEEMARAEADPSTIVQKYTPRTIDMDGPQGWSNCNLSIIVPSFNSSLNGLPESDGGAPSIRLNGKYIGGWDRDGQCPRGKGQASWNFEMPPLPSHLLSSYQKSPKTQKRKISEYYADELDPDYDAPVDISESYEGMWKNGMRDGLGTQKYCERRGGGQYEGTWQMDAPSGYGKREYDYMSIAVVVTNTSRETGYYKKIRSRNKSQSDLVVPVCYEGSWKNGFWFGEGTLTYSDGVSLKCRSWDAIAIASGSTVNDKSSKLSRQWTAELHALELNLPSDSARNAPGIYTGAIRLKNPTNGPGLRTRRGGIAFVVASTIGTSQRHGRGRQVFFGASDRNIELQARKKAMGPHGAGIYSLVGKGDVYDGEWFDDVRHGFGKMDWKDGTKYVGEWRNGLMNGTGILEMWTHERYEGKFIGGLRNGRGRCDYPNGQIYIGRWKDGKPHGKGEFINADGGKSKFVGTWANGARQGSGILLTQSLANANSANILEFDGKSGEAVSVIYLNGEPQEQTVVSLSSAKGILESLEETSPHYQSEGKCNQNEDIRSPRPDFFRNLGYRENGKRK